MKKLILLAGLAIIGLMPAFSQSRKMVVDSKGNVEGRYVRTNKNTYTCLTQDEFDVPIQGHHITTFSAENGDGVLYPQKPGKINVRNNPSTNGNIIGKIIYDSGYLPEAYPCLGKVNGWYKTKVNGKIGYVKADLMEWDAICTD